MNIRELEAIIEGLLFASGDLLSLNKISEILEVDRKTVRSIINNMTLKYGGPEHGIGIREIDGGYQMYAKPEYYDYIKKLFEPRQRQGLSQAAFEALSIIVHNQPVTKAKIEKIRGVNSDSAIERLLERNLIRDAGRMDCPGKPILYEVTEEFLRTFGFKTVNEIKSIPLESFGHTEAGEEDENVGGT